MIEAEKLNKQMKTDEIKHKCRVEQLEADLIRAKQDLGEALNTMHTFEVDHMEYCGVLERQRSLQHCSSFLFGRAGGPHLLLLDISTTCSIFREHY